MTEDQLRKILNEELTKELLKFASGMNLNFDSLKKQIDGKADKSDVDRLLKAFDAVAKQQEVEEHERLAINHQIDRHERWHHQTADHLGLKLDTP